MIELGVDTRFRLWEIAIVISDSVKLVGIGLIAIAIAVVIAAVILKRSKNKKS